MRKDFILENLKEAQELITQIKAGKEEVEKIKNGQHLFSAKVTSCLVLLKTCLEYCSKDIYELILQATDGLAEDERKAKKRYFPYGKSQAGFNSMMGSSLPRLKETNLDIYRIIESIQPHINSDMWLYNLSILANIAKHDKPDQERKDNYGGVKLTEDITILGSSIIVSAGGNINGKKVEKEVRIGADSTEEDLNKYFNNAVKLNFAKFTFKETGQEIIPTLEIAQSKVSDFYIKLYKQLDETQI